MKRSPIAVAALLACATAAAQVSGEVALRSAMEKESVRGDLRGAIEQYRKLAQGKDRAIAARALVGMGECYEKLGGAEARKAYERVVREFADQKDTAESARAHLSALGGVPSAPSMRRIATAGTLAGVSPDEHFLLQRASDGAMNLLEATNGRTRQITKGNFYQPVFSPDCRRIAFMRPGDKNIELRVVNVDGSGERHLWKSDTNWAAGIPQWFPDAKRILVLAWANAGRRRLLSISVPEGATTELWDGRSIYSTQLSPDGKYVAFMRRGRNEPVGDQIWMLRLQDRSETLLLDGQSYVNYPRWTPDGAGILFLSDRRAPQTTVDLWLLRIRAGKPPGFPELVKADLGRMENSDTLAAPSGPITRHGAYYFQRKKNTDIFQLLITDFDPETGKVTGSPEYVSKIGGMSRSPSFSADGRWLTYIRQRGEERIVRLNPAALILGWAVMFPDGKSVLVDAVHPTEGSGLYRVDAASGLWAAIKKPSDKTHGFAHNISPDGKTIYLTRRNETLVSYIARDIKTAQFDGRDYPTTSEGMTITLRALDTHTREAVYRAKGVEVARCRESVAADRQTMKETCDGKFGGGTSFHRESIAQRQ